jgi:asparagine synthase (glutamine-hydrolysing)
MPELCGVFQPGGLSPALRQAAQRLREDLLAHGGEARDAEGPELSLCVARHHRGDPARLEPLPDGARVAWIGEPGAQAPALARAVREAGAGLAALAPPFAGVVAEAGGRVLRLFGDRFGLHPLHYARRGDALVFSTRLAPLLRSGFDEWRIDRRALLDFFTYEHPTGVRTLAAGVELLPPAAVLSFDGGEPVVERFAGPPLPSRIPGPGLDAWADRLHDELLASVEAAVGDRERVAITLSGGLDSRALLGCAVQVGARPRTFTFGTSGARDVVRARALAGRAGAPHTAVAIDAGCLPRWLDHGIHVTGGGMSCIHFHILSLAEALAGEADLALDGLAGDALTGGHLEWRMLLARTPDAARSSLYRQRATAWADAAERAALFEPDFLAAAAYAPEEALAPHFEDAPGAPPWWGCHRFDLLERQRRFIQHGPHLLRPFVDVRTPFYAPALYDLALAAPTAYLVEQRGYLRMHARRLRSLAEVPDSARGIALTWPAPVRFAKRALDAASRRLPPPLARRLAPADAAPTDYAGWLRGELREWLRERLLPPNPGFEGILRRPAVEATLEEHLSGRADRSVRLGCLLTFDAWRRSVPVRA